MAKVNIVVSEKYQIIWDDVISILKGGAIMAAGSLSISVLEYLSKQDFGQVWTPILALVTSLAINAIRKLLTEKKYIQ